MTFKGIDLTPLLGGLITLVAGALTWAATKVSSAASAAADEKNTRATLLRLGAIATAALGRSWDRLAPTVQKAIADGKVTEEERAILELAVKDVLRDFVSEDELKGYAVALKLPLPGIIAKIASMILDTFTRAHDPGIPEVSAKSFPVYTETTDDRSMDAGG